MNIFLNKKINPDVNDFEIIERKGLGHPDTLADGIAEYLSNSYSKYCLKRFGCVLHHNLDKIYVSGGLVNCDFLSEKKILKPMVVYINGRASASFSGKKINLKKLFENFAKEYLTEILPNLKKFKSPVKVEFITNTFSHNPYWYNPRGVQDLPDKKRPYANDTSTVVGFYPLSKSEKKVIAVESFFYNNKGLPRFNYVGQDIKIMLVRNKDKTNITTNIPILISYVKNYNEYLKKKNFITKKLVTFLSKEFPREKINLSVNTLDRMDQESHYTLLIGTCSEAGEEGLVGRGNKTNGLISTCRPISMEALHGKNPVYHVGKVLTYKANNIAKDISKEFDCYCSVFITTKAGEDISSPSYINIEINKKCNNKIIESIVSKNLQETEYTIKIIEGEFLPKSQIVRYKKHEI
ncbi:MAG: methionine adenosyltransferase [Patescibacteria group bacterium]|nr:methionine adenosyltransferase [Patescibacteria group bacterium]